MLRTLMLWIGDVESRRSFFNFFLASLNCHAIAFGQPFGGTSSASRSTHPYCQPTANLSSSIEIRDQLFSTCSNRHLVDAEVGQVWSELEPCWCRDGDKVVSG